VRREKAKENERIVLEELAAAATAERTLSTETELLRVRELVAELQDRLMVSDVTLAESQQAVALAEEEVRRLVTEVRGPFRCALVAWLCFGCGADSVVSRRRADASTTEAGRTPRIRRWRL
jgi:hypothetical protein